MSYSTPPSTALKRQSFVLPTLALLLALAGCQNKSPVIATRFAAFGTQVDVSLVGVDQAQAQQAVAHLAQDFASLERDWQAGTPGSMARVNRLLATGESFVAPPSTLTLVQLSKTLALRSDGLFNPAIGELTQLWGFRADRTDSHPPPSAAQIAHLVAANPSLSQIEIDGLTLRSRNPRLKLDFSAIGASQAIDLAIRHLRELGIANALVRVGGQLRAIGDRNGQPWRIPIPRSNGSGVFAMLALRGDESLTTRAESDRNFLFEGALYHDVIDPRTGWPATATRAVTVIHDDSLGATAAATALFIAGPDDWPRIAANLGVSEVLLMDRQGRTQMSQEMAQRIELVDRRVEIVVSESPDIESPDTDLPNAPAANPQPTTR